MGAVLTDLLEQLQNGRNLSTAMASHPQVFNRLIISMVHVGEDTGRLDEAFLQLSFYFEQEQETRKQIKQASRYPTMVLVALLIALVIMNLFVIRNLLPCLVVLMPSYLGQRKYYCALHLLFTIGPIC
ncbi:hypothetical protein ALON55S_06177 [Alishewanella longhuensis]